MADPNFVRSMRDEAKPVRQTGVVDILLGAVALLAIAAAGYFGVTWWTGQTSAPATALAAPAIVTASLAPGDGWTDSDTKRCESQAHLGSDDHDLLLANPTIVEGFPYLAGVVACKITTKADRFCDPTEKAALVALVNDYLARVGLVIAALKLEGTPMNLMSGLGGEVAAGAEIHDMMVDDTISFMNVYHKDVANGLKSLARDGVITAGDFGAFMGFGVPPMVKEMLDGVEVTGHRCG
jgi:hypothetical protein